MEQLLLPFNPTSPVAKVPYVARQRYDGLPFLKYAKRNGNGKFFYGDPSPGFVFFHRDQMMSHQPSPEEQEPFFQTWLFFGLLSEFFGGNAEDDSHDPGARNETLDFIYTNFTYEENGQKFVTTAKFLSIIGAAIGAADKDLGDVEKKSRVNHLVLCVRYASAVLLTCSEGFNPDIRLSIAAMGECLMWLLAAWLQELKMEQSAFCVWEKGLFTAQMQNQMIQNGWCPSDIAKCKNNTQSVAALHFLSKIDKSRPERSHSNCTERFCSAGQIDLSNYKVGHIKEDCNCQPIENIQVLDVLDKEDKFPVLKISGGKKNLHDLAVEVFESDISVPFVAISHVWADGLGNPTANSLHRCQLAQLRDCVQGIKEFAPTEGGDEEQGVMVWLDTLCCPVGPPSAKKLALERIRNVYREAFCVLVFDANLRAYPAMPMTVYEIFARISTSAWMRRLWTLQEGALAKSLLFQFADQCVSLDFLYLEIQKSFKENLCYRGFFLAVKRETDIVRAFFFSERYAGLPVHLPLLGMALHHRSVTVPTDEALCISTLLSLDISAVLSSALPAEERMCVVWEQLALSKPGIPAVIIFFTDRRMDIPGFRWAPRSLLGVTLEGINPTERSSYNGSARAERLTPIGLQVRYPGFSIKQRSYNDGLPHDPWWGSLKDKNNGRPRRIVENFIQFRDGEDAWFRICRQETICNGRTQSSEEQREWKPDMEFPLYDILSTDHCALLVRQIPPVQSSSVGEVGLIVSYRDKEVPNNLFQNVEAASALHVRSEGHILLFRCRPNDILILSTCERIATDLRGSHLTKILCAVKDKNSDEFQRIMDDLTKEMKRIMKEALDGDPKLVDAFNAIADDLLDHAWKYVANWFRQDVFIAERLPADQLWFVD